MDSVWWTADFESAAEKFSLPVVVVAHNTDDLGKLFRIFRP